MSIKIYSRFGTPGRAQEQAELAKRFGSVPDTAPHGLPGSAISALHARGERMLGSIASPEAARQDLLQSVLPPGRMPEFRSRSAQMMSAPGPMGYGSGQGNSFFTNTRPYQPEFECGRGDTLVCMADGTRCRLDHIRIGDRVLDRTGRVQTVVSQWSSGTPAELIEIVTWGGKKFFFTENHHWPVWAWTRTCQCTPDCEKLVTPGRLYFKNHYRGGGAGDDRIHIRGSKKRTGKGNQSIPKNYEPMQKLRAAEIRVGDFLLMPRKFDPITTTATEEDARLLGYYLAEGSILEGGAGLCFTFSAEERTTWAEDANQLLHRRGFLTTINVIEDCGATQLCTRNDYGRIDTRPWVAQIRARAGEGSITKRLSEEVMRWPLKLKWELVKGALRGDGHQQWRISTKKGYEGRAFGVHYTTTSQTLAGQMQLVLAQLGFPARMTTVPVTIRKMRGKSVTCAETYILTVPAPFAFDLANAIWGEEESQAYRFERREEIRPECMIDDDFIYVPVKSVRRIANDKPVYNLTVSGDHSYLVDNIATFNSIDRQMFPVHRRLANTYWRLFAKMDPIIAATIDLFSQLPWSEFQLTGEGVDGEVKEVLEHMISETKLLAMLPFFVSEHMIVGEVVPHTFFDESKGIWTHIALHNPDQINVVYSPFLHMNPIMEFVPDPKLREIVTSNHPMLARIRETMPAELVSQLRANQNIALSPANSSFIPRKLHPYDLRGTSIISRLWRTLMLEDAIWTATIQTARRASSPVKIVKLGDPTTGTIPTASEEKRVLQLLAQAEMDPQSWLCYNYQIQFELAGAPERLMSINTHYDLIERIKLVALGVSKSFVSGETSYQSAAAGLTVFLQRLKAVRDFFVNEWLIPKYFLPIAILNEWIKPSKAQASKGHIRVKRSSRELMEEARYIVPTIEWSKSLDSQIDRERIDAMVALEQQLGIKISDQRKYAAVGFDSEEEQKQIVEELKFKKDLAGQDPQLQTTLGLLTDTGAGPGGGGGGGGVLSPGIPPAMMGMPGEGEGVPPGGGGGGGGEGGGESLPPEGAPGGEVNQAPPAPSGASISGEEGSEPEPAQDRAGSPSYWREEDVRPLVTLLQTCSTDNIRDEDAEPWIHMLKDPYVQEALKREDKHELWLAVGNWLIDENYPTAAIRDLEDKLAATGAIEKRAVISEAELDAAIEALGGLGPDAIP